MPTIWGSTECWRDWAEAEADWKVRIAASKAASFGLKHSTVLHPAPTVLAVVHAGTRSSRRPWLDEVSNHTLLSCLSEAGS